MSGQSAEQLKQAAQLLQNGASAAAERMLSAIVSRDPSDADAQGLLGIALAQQQNFSAAAEVLQRALRLNPSNPGTLTNYANVLKKLGRLEEAAESARRVIALRPGHAPAHRQLGSILLDLHRYQEAAETFAVVIGQKPDDPASLNDRALAFLGLGKIENALNDLDVALRLDPQFTPALSNKAGALLRLGRADEAIAVFEQAEAIAPANATVVAQKGFALLACGRIDSAEIASNKALQLDARLAVCWALRGDVLRAQGRLSDAISSFERALGIDPNDWDAQFGVGLAYSQGSNWHAAVEALNRAAALRPDHAATYLERAKVARGLGNAPAALFDLENVLRLDPQNIEAFVMRAALNRASGRREEALVDCERALQLDPKNWSAHNNRGVLLDELGRHEEALGNFEAALALNPNDPDVFQNMGMTLLSLRRSGEAIAKCDDALRREPESVSFHNLKGSILVAQRAFDAALGCFDSAVAIDPGSVISNYLRFYPLMAQGRLIEGFAAWEWRRRGDAPVVKFPAFQNELQVGENPAGKRVLVYCEQGLGDIVHFARFARLLADMGATVLFVAYPTLARLMQSLGPDIQIIPMDGPEPAFDTTCPLLSLPHKLQTTWETIPSRTPYLSAPPELAELWAQRLPRGDGLRVGLAWSGNPQYANDVNRSLALESLRPWLSTPGVSFVSVQKDVRTSDEDALKAAGVWDFRAELTDFADTAALISQLDLVIAVDTSVAHLAGALGKPVWIALSAVSDWRWLEQRNDSPWYPTARLFRQKQVGDWEPVLAEMAGALSKLAGRPAPNG